MLSSQRACTGLSAKEKDILYQFICDYNDGSEHYILKKEMRFHKEVWLRASGADLQIKAHPGYYDSLKKA